MSEMAHPESDVLLKEADALELRKHLWLSHGHQGVYGDDGEMQCCALDFRRMPFDALSAKVVELRKARLSNALADFGRLAEPGRATPIAQTPARVCAACVGLTANGHVCCEVCGGPLEPGRAE